MKYSRKIKYLLVLESCAQNMGKLCKLRERFHHKPKPTIKGIYFEQDQYIFLQQLPLKT